MESSLGIIRRSLSCTLSRTPAIPISSHSQPIHNSRWSSRAITSDFFCTGEFNYTGKRLTEDGARPIIFYDRCATCWQPQVKGLTVTVNSIFSGWRMEDVWLDK